MRILKHSLLLSATITAAPAVAQTVTPPLAAESRVSSDAIIVTATRTERRAWTTGEAISIIDREEIDDSQIVRATDLLRRLPGVAISPSGGLGQPTSVFLRGADNAQTLVLVDGVRLNDPSDVGGGYNYGSLLVGDFSQVEVVRGAQSVIWGSQAIGGVINFRTPEPGGEWRGRASAEYGARDFVNLIGAASGSAGPVGLSVGAQYVDTDGYSAFSEDRGATERDGFEGLSAFGKAEIALSPALSLTAGGFYSDSEYDFDDSTADNPDNYGKKRDLTGFAFAKYRSGIFEGRVGYTITDTDRLSYTVSSFGPFRIDYEGRREFIEAIGTVKPSDAIALTLGGEHEYSEFGADQQGTGFSATQDADANIDSVFGQASYVAGDALALNAGARYDEHSDYGGEVSLSASAAYRLPGGITLRASYGEGYRAPSLYQRFFNLTQVFGGPGPELQAESAKSYDLGIALPFAEYGSFEVTGFKREVEDELLYTNAGGFYFNADTRAKGIELSYLYGGPAVDVRLSYTYLDTKDSTTGDVLLRRPKHNLFMGVTVRPVEALSLGADVTHGGARSDTIGFPGTVVGIDAFTTLDLRANYDVTDTFSIYGRVENVTDKEYELVTNYGQPGRNATVGVRARF